jgi:hypothetical protein
MSSELPPPPQWPRTRGALCCCGLGVCALAFAGALLAIYLRLELWYLPLPVSLAGLLGAVAAAQPRLREGEAVGSFFGAKQEQQMHTMNSKPLVYGRDSIATHDSRKSSSSTDNA